ncbi:MAG: hypothetical protein IT562_06210 [Alphaproteobacteria bacterium]|nr:hypothetical protein [Alphaproteobacteria bacterium]
MTATPPFLPGQFVWCNFPFRETPSDPGPERDIAYVVDILRKGDRLLVCATLYTTTRLWPRDRARPPGLVPVAGSAAQNLGQSTFAIDARRVAYMPIDERFFPDLHRPDRGIRGTAPRALQDQVTQALVRLLQRPDLLELLGPERPGKPVPSRRNPRR